MKQVLLTILLVAFTFGVTACEFNEEKAEDAIAVASGIIEQAQDDYEEKCVAGPTRSDCQAINRAVTLHKAAIESLNLYCAGPAWQEEDGPCDPPTDEEKRKHLESRVKEALSNLNSIIDVVKELIQ